MTVCFPPTLPLFHRQLSRGCASPESGLLNFRLIPAGCRASGLDGCGSGKSATGSAEGGRAHFDLFEHLAKLGGNRFPLFVGVDGTVEDGFAFRVFRGEGAPAVDACLLPGRPGSAAPAGIAAYFNSAK